MPISSKGKPGIVLLSQHSECIKLVRSFCTGLVALDPRERKAIQDGDVVLLDAQSRHPPARRPEDCPVACRWGAWHRAGLCAGDTLGQTCADLKCGAPAGLRTLCCALREIMTTRPRCRVFLLSDKKNIDLATCVVMGAQDYLPHGFGLVDGLPELDSGSSLGDLPAGPQSGGSPRQVHLFEMSRRKLYGYVRYRMEHGTGSAQTGTARGFGPNVVGVMLEDFAFYFLGAVRGFKCFKGRTGRTGQIDVLVRNERHEGLWGKAGMFFAVECKNQSANVRAQAVVKLIDFARLHSGSVKLVMLFHTANGLTPGARDRVLTEGPGPVCLLEMNASRICELMTLPEEPVFLSGFAEDRLKEALTQHVLAYDSSG